MIMLFWGTHATFYFSVTLFPVQVTSIVFCKTASRKE